MRICAGNTLRVHASCISDYVVQLTFDCRYHTLFSLNINYGEDEFIAVNNRDAFSSCWPAIELRERIASRDPKGFGNQ